MTYFNNVTRHTYLNVDGGETRDTPGGLVLLPLVTAMAAIMFYIGSQLTNYLLITQL